MALLWRVKGDSGVVAESELLASSDVPDCIGGNGLLSVEGSFAVGNARVIESRLQDEHAADWVFAGSGCHNSGDGHVVVNEGMGHARISRGAVVTQAQELLLILWLQLLECCEDGQLSGSVRR